MLRNFDPAGPRRQIDVLVVPGSFIDFLAVNFQRGDYKLSCLHDVGDGFWAKPFFVELLDQTFEYIVVQWRCLDADCSLVSSVLRKELQTKYDWRYCRRVMRVSKPIKESKIARTCRRYSTIRSSTSRRLGSRSTSRCQRANT